MHNIGRTFGKPFFTQHSKTWNVLLESSKSQNFIGSKERDKNLNTLSKTTPFNKQFLTGEKPTQHYHEQYIRIYDK